MTHEIQREKQTLQEHLRKTLTSVIIHWKHIDNKRTIIVRRFQTINRLSNQRHHHGNEESRSFKTESDGQDL